jgi:signal transduction histidine kinase
MGNRRRNTQENLDTMKLWQNYVPSFKNIKNTLRYLEWILILATIPYSLLDGINPIKLAIFSAAFVIMSMIFPLDRPFWFRQGYILLGLILVSLARWADPADLDLSIMLSIYIAKSCFLLEFRFVVINAFLAGIVDLSAIFTTPPDFSEQLRASKALQELGFASYFYEMSENYYVDQAEEIAAYISWYVPASVFAILFSYAIIAEQKSRQKAELLTQQVENLAASLERNRIARDLHDSLGHSLSSLQIQLSVAQKFRQRNLAKSFEAVDTAKVLADLSIEDIKRSLKTMRDSNFDLDRAIHDLLNRYKQNKSLQIESLISLPKLSLPVSHNIHCLIKEALINIEKHSQATFIRLHLQGMENEIILEVEDNGIGFDANQFYSGYGIKGMKERVRSHNGKITIDSVCDRGTKINITIPR